MHALTKCGALQATAFVLIDHQAGICDWVQSIDRTQLKRNALMPAGAHTHSRWYK
jgi:hypothetical protein